MFHFKSELGKETGLHSFRKAERPKHSLFHQFLTCRSPLVCFILFLWRRTLLRGRFLELMPFLSSRFAMRIAILFWALAFANASRAQDAPVPSSQTETQTPDATVDSNPSDPVKLFPH
jgi:hypothetical protein